MTKSRKPHQISLMGFPFVVSNYLYLMLTLLELRRLALLLLSRSKEALFLIGFQSYLSIWASNPFPSRSASEAVLLFDPISHNHLRPCEVNRSGPPNHFLRFLDPTPSPSRCQRPRDFLSHREGNWLLSLHEHEHAAQDSCSNR